MKQAAEELDFVKACIFEGPVSSIKKLAKL